METVLTSIYLNTILCVMLMLMYECLRRLLPSVYSSEMKHQYKMTGGWKVGEESTASTPQHSRDNLDGQNHDQPFTGNEDPYVQLDSTLQKPSDITDSSSSSQRSFMDLPKNGSLPDVISFNWVSNVVDVPWESVRKYAGLDGYFFLRCKMKHNCINGCLFVFYQTSQYSFVFDSSPSSTKL